MGATKPMRVFRVFTGRRKLPPLSEAARGIRPRDYQEWKTLRSWGALPDWELDPPGFLQRLTREGARLTQNELAERVGVTQQAVARAERWDANPTVAFLRRWAWACGKDVEIVFTNGGSRPDPR